MVIVSKTKSLHRLTILTSNKKNISLHVALLKKTLFASLPVTETSKKKKKHQTNHRSS